MPHVIPCDPPLHESVAFGPTMIGGGVIGDGDVGRTFWQIVKLTGSLLVLKFPFDAETTNK